MVGVVWLLRKLIVGDGVALVAVVVVVVIVDEDEDKVVLEAIDDIVTLLDDNEVTVTLSTTTRTGVFDFECEADPPTPPPTPAAIIRIIRMAKTRKNILRFNPKILFSCGGNGSVISGVCSAAAVDSYWSES